MVLLNKQHRSVMWDLLNQRWPPLLGSFFFFASFPYRLVTSSPQVLKTHLLLFRLPRQHSELGFDMYDQLPPIRAKRLKRVLQTQDSSGDQRDWRWGKKRGRWAGETEGGGSETLILRANEPHLIFFFFFLWLKRKKKHTQALVSFH